MNFPTKKSFIIRKKKKDSVEIQPSKQTEKEPETKKEIVDSCLECKSKCLYAFWMQETKIPHPSQLVSIEDVRKQLEWELEWISDPHLNQPSQSLGFAWIWVSLVHATTYVSTLCHVSFLFLHS